MKTFAGETQQKPMSPERALHMILDPALQLLPATMDSKPAEIMLLAIALQESRFVHRVQINGPARGFWQFEKGGGVRGVMKHAKSRPFAESLCKALGHAFDLDVIYDALALDDVLACGFARLLLFTDPAPLPKDAGAGWDYYYRNWRPGKPHRETWDDFYAQASRIVQ